MKKFFTLAIIALLAASSQLKAQGAMTESQIIEYAQKGAMSGKSQVDIAKELIKKGATRDQLLNLKKLYDAQSGTGAAGVSPSGGDTELSTNSMRKSPTVSDENLDPSAKRKVRRRYARNEYFETPESGIDRGSGMFAEEEDEYTVYPDEYEEELPDSLKVFGHDVFTKRTLTFAPNTKLATPKNYVLGPGDEVVIDIFGANQTSERQEISADGNINIDILGPLHLGGMTIEKANAYLKDKLAGIYAGLGEDGKTDIMLTLGQIRTVQVIVMGEARTPGTYNLSSLSTAFHALYRAGGITYNGSLRNIKVMRNGTLISTIDVYKFLVYGDRRSDVVLQDGDVIVIPTYANMVHVSGMVKRAMFFEMKEGESMAKLMEYTGGFSNGAFRDRVSVVRQSGRSLQVKTVNRQDFANFAMTDGDEVTVSEMTSRFENRLQVKGAVYQPGLYELGSNVRSVKGLIDVAGGLLPEAFTSRAVLHRERTDRTLEVLSVDVEGILAGKTKDITLRTNDVLYIPSIFDMQDLGTLTITGEVNQPGIFKYADNTTVEDLILQAGGLLSSASLMRVDVERRITDNTGLKAQAEIAETYSFKVKDGFVVDGEQGFILKPYDNVVVRKAPSYVEQRFVSVKGEANFTGRFVMASRDQRLSDIIKRAGGVTDFAYIKGARLERKFTPEQKERLRELVQQMQGTSDSARIKVSDTYYVAINLEEALQNPGGEHDIVLMEDDILEIPVYQNVVRVAGAVMSPNAQVWLHGKNGKYYIDRAGGFAHRARRSHAYVMEMNGTVRRMKDVRHIEPGSEIIVPRKSPSTTNWMQVATTSTSLATALATVYNILKK